MNLSRRGFLKVLGVGAATVALPASTLQAIAESVEAAFERDKFNPVCEYGNAIPIIPGRASNPAIEREVIRCLAKDLRKHIPRKYLPKVQFRKSVPTNYGRTSRIAWYYCPANDRGYLGPNGMWDYHSSGGCFIWRKI